MRVLGPRTAIDLFAGAGGTTQGLRDAGYEIVAAVENDRAAAATYRANHEEVSVFEQDILEVDPADAEKLLGERRLDVLTACPPCQGFSTLGSRDAQDPRNDLVDAVLPFVTALQPAAIMLENVPGLEGDDRLLRLEATLGADYQLGRWVIDAAAFGVPQHRRRMIVLAVRKPAAAFGHRDLLDLLPEGFDRSARSAGAAIAFAGPIASTQDPVHRARTPRKMTLRRIEVMPVGGGRLDLPEELRLVCHKRLEKRSATSIYGRIDADEPSPTMTTRCTTPSCGRFVHPSEHRGLSLREAALLQTFPLSYRFPGDYGQTERQIGNAVPCRLAQALGLIVDGLREADRQPA